LRGGEGRACPHQSSNQGRFRCAYNLRRLLITEAFERDQQERLPFLRGEHFKQLRYRFTPGTRPYWCATAACGSFPLPPNGLGTLPLPIELRESGVHPRL
jgi:hypothetical protein